MSKKHKFSITEARRIALTAQGLTEEFPFGKGLKGTLKTIEHLGYIQIDTISVVERAHHHVLWSRVPDYTPSLLHDLQQKKLVFEYWSHAAAYLPTRDYRFSLPRKLAFASGQRHWFARNRRIMKYVLDKITVEGPLMSKDFDAAHDRKSGPWFDWKPSKIALEQLFMEGTLMVRERRGFQKVYDLKDRVLPTSVDQTPPTQDEYARYLIETALRSHGIVTELEIRYLRKGIQIQIRKVLKEMAASGEICEAVVEGIEDQKFYVFSKNIESSSQARNIKKNIHILSPFDNLIIQRKRLKSLFEFDYLIECYVPDKKRKYGYFCLPLLYGDKLIGRLDAKADRKKKTLIIQSMNFEPTFKPTSLFKSVMQSELKKFSRFNGCELLKT